MSRLNRALPTYGYISAEQQQAMNADALLIRQRREAAEWHPIMEKRSAIAGRVNQYEEFEPSGEINCARCVHIGDFNAEHQRGYCMWLRFMVATWHPNRCKAFSGDA